VFINNSGDTEGKAGMATAGSGDVLNGTIAAMFLPGAGYYRSRKNGCFLCTGFSGDLAAKKKGPDGMTAGDILNTLHMRYSTIARIWIKLQSDYNNTVHGDLADSYF